MSKHPEIVVRGQAQARVMPDRAILSVRVEETGQTSEQAYAAAAVVTTAVDGVLERFKEHLSRVVTASVTVSPKTRWRKGESQRTGWRAQRSTRIEVTDAEQLGALINEVASAGATVTGPEWMVDPDNPAIAELRRAAAAEARTRAGDYAAGLGIELGAVRSVSEPGVGGRQSFVEPGFARFAAPAGGMRDEPEIEITPEELDMSLEVEVAFQILG